MFHYFQGLAQSQLRVNTSSYSYSFLVLLWLMNADTSNHWKKYSGLNPWPDRLLVMAGFTM